MHSPFEVSGKLDVYMAYRTYKEFFLLVWFKKIWYTKSALKRDGFFAVKSVQKVPAATFIKMLIIHILKNILKWLDTMAFMLNITKTPTSSFRCSKEKRRFLASLNAWRTSLLRLSAMTSLVHVRSPYGQFWKFAARALRLLKFTDRFWFCLISIPILIPLSSYQSAEFIKKLHNPFGAALPCFLCLFLITPINITSFYFCVISISLKKIRGGVARTTPLF